MAAGRRDNALMLVSGRSAVAAGFASVGAVVLAGGTAPAETRRPDIVFILADDLGWADLGCYGSTFYETPNLDRLAREGVRFTDAYAACPVCSPTRASILTGQYPARVGVTNYIGGTARGRLIDAPYTDHLPLEQKTIAEALNAGGYQTWHVGKWHLGGKGFWPEQQGFEVNIAGCGMGHPPTYFAPYRIPTLMDGSRGEYLNDRLTDESIRLIGSRDKSRPFFLSLWHYAVHTPIESPPALVEKYREKARRLGLDVEAKDPGEPFPTEKKRNQHVTRRRVQADPAYAAMMENLDRNIGRLLEALDRENTLIIFTSDNGGLATAEGSPTCNAPLREGKGWMYEGGIRVPLIVSGPGVAKAKSYEVPVISTDFYPTLLSAAKLPAMPTQHVDGEDLMPLLVRTGPLRRDTLYWHYPHYGNQGGTPAGAIRAGRWKLIEFFEDGRRELYDLSADPGEQHDLAGAHAELARQLHDRLVSWRRSVGAVMPASNPTWQGATTQAASRPVK